MSLTIPPGFGSAALVFSDNLGTAPFVTTIGVDLSGVGGDYVVAANSIMLNYADAFKAVTHSSLVLQRCQLAVGQDGPGGSVDSDLEAIAMTSTGAPNALAMSVIARKTTGELGRAGRGRMFLPGVCLSSGINADGSLTSGYRVIVADAMAEFVNLLVNDILAPTPPVLLHAPPVEAAPTPITALVPAPLVGWIRGRIY